MKKFNFFILLSCVVLTQISCRKEADTLAVITVKDTDGLAVSDAEVRIFPVPTDTPPNEIILEKILITNQSGQAIFDFTEDFKLGQAGMAVLNVEVYKDDFFGEGIIKIVEEQRNEETVIIQLQ